MTGHLFDEPRTLFASNKCQQSEKPRFELHLNPGKHTQAVIFSCVILVMVTVIGAQTRKITGCNVNCWNKKAVT